MMFINIPPQPEYGITPFRLPVKKKVKEWLFRYGPAEVLSLVTTLVGALAAWVLTHSRIAVSLTATWCGNIGYFGYIFIADIFAARKALILQGRHYTRVTLYKNIRALIVEFGVAELLDSFLVRPAFMYYIPLFLGNMAMGIIIAKFVADITFYIPAILSYELTKKKLRKFD